MKTKHIPALVTLLAGAVAALLMWLWKVDFFTFTRNLLIVLVIFYILGIVIKVILDRNFKDMEEETTEEGEGGAGEGTEEQISQENVDTEDEDASGEEKQ